MPRINVYDGAMSIGGTKLLLDDNGCRYLFDFGKDFVRESSVFGDDFSSSGDFERRRELMHTLGMLPPLGDRNYYHPGKQADAEAPDIQGVFLSHAHRDHDGCISLLDRRIPLYGMKETLCLYFRNQSVKGEKDRPRHVLDEEELQLERIKVRAIRVDHSIPGACAFLVTTSGGCRIVYTGDFRLHGTRESFGATVDFIQKAKEFAPHLLITEGTNINEYSNEAEEVQGNGTNAGSLRSYLDTEMQLAFEHGGMLIVGVSGNNIDRIDTIYEAVRDCPEATLHVAVFNARLLADLERDCATRFDPTHIVRSFRDDPRVHLYERKVGELKKDEKPTLLPGRQHLLSDYGTGDKALQRRAVLLLYDGDVAELVKIDPGGLSKYIHCESEPFTDDLQLDNQRLQTWLARYDLTYHQIHTSGHIYGAQLKQVIREINPGVVLPLHTLHPEHFRDVLPGDDRCRLVKNGEEVDLTDLTVPLRDALPLAVPEHARIRLDIR